MLRFISISLLLFCLLGAAQRVAAQSNALPAPQPVTTPTESKSEPAVTGPAKSPEVVEAAPGYSESGPAPAPRPSRCDGVPRDLDAQTALKTAHTIFIRSRAPWVRAHEIEDGLLKKRGFSELGFTITRNEGEADLVLELGHKYMTTRFFFTVVESCSQSVVASGSVSSLFGTVHGKVADSFVKQVRRARQH